MWWFFTFSPVGVARLFFYVDESPRNDAGKGFADVTPEALVASILKRRAAAASSLPTTLEQRTEENNRAYQLANDARTSLKQLEAEENPDEGHHSGLRRHETCTMNTKPFAVERILG